ncbi:MAG TPA: hypothetical protein VL200_09365 [Lacunisphaera sp.]|jgi:hypothetical protein|nr:hypothetical protein [Lacunisphaera sp.]
MNKTARLILALPRATWRETTVLLVAAGLVPFLIHLLPWAGPRPLGVYLLPVFWMTFLAVYFHGALLGLAVGLVTPLLNLALTGLPMLNATGAMALEVVGFVVAAALLAGRWPRLWVAAPLAWLAGKAAAIAVLLLAEGGGEPPVTHLLHSARNAWAGLVVLAAINVLLVVFCPKGDEWERE